MSRDGTKEAAEAILLELPSVVGAHVREDVFGHPREIHLLVSAGPSARHLARDIRDLLEERLGVPVDQRIISIAQLAQGAAAPGDAPPSVAAEPGSEPADAATHPAPELPAATNPPLPTGDVEARIRFLGIGLDRTGNRVQARVRLERGRQVTEGEAEELDSPLARVRVGAAALLGAMTGICGGRARFDLEDAAIVRAFGRQIVLVNVLAHAPAAGRRPLTLSGAHPLEEAGELAAALAALKAVNRIAGLALR
jgi:hypothetical protein